MRYIEQVEALERRSKLLKASIWLLDSNDREAYVKI